MSLCPSTVASGGLLPEDFYFALKSDIAPPQVLSQNANTVSLSGGGGAVNIASTSAVALSTNKLTAVTYDTGLLETNVAGILNVGLGSAIGSTRVEGGKIVIQRDPGEPQIEFVKGVNVERIKYDGTKLLMGPVGIDGEIYDNFGSPGAAGQQLQSSGPGLPFVWGAGSGVGLTAVVAGSNIFVDNTNPIAPIVNVAISSTLDMLGQEITNALDVTIKGTNPSVDFENSTGVQKASLDYVEAQDKISLTGLNVVAEAIGAGRGHRMILDAAGAALTSQDADVTLQRSETFVGIKTIMTLEDNALVQIGAAGIGGLPTLKLLSSGGNNGVIEMDEANNTFGLKSANENVVVESTNNLVNILAPAVNTGIQLIAGASSANLTVADGSGTGTISMAIGGDIQASLGGGGNIGVGGNGADGSVFLIKNGGGVYGALNYNGTNDTLNVDNGGSGISVGASGIAMTPANGIVEVKSDNTLGYPPTLTFNETSTPATATTVFNGTALTTSMPSGFNLILDSSTFDITTTASRLKVNGGAVEGVQMGLDSGQNVNYVAGYGLPMRLAHTDAVLSTDYIELNQATGGVCKIVQTESITLTTPSVLLGGITTYDTGAGVQNTVFADVNGLEQVLTNNAYVPMTAYDRGISFTINPAKSLAFDTNAFTGGSLFRWRYSGQFGPSGLGGRSRYCGALRFQVDVNIASRDWDNPDTITWWVELNDTANGQVYEAQDFGTNGERAGFITTSQINPHNGSTCHTVSFSSIFDLDTSVTGQPTPDDGDDCSFSVYGWGGSTTTTGRANVSVSIRPMRNLV